MGLVLVVAAALVRGNSVLVSKRPEGKAMAGMWEFPGGKVEPSETPEDALVRELAEELGITVAPADLTPLTFASHAYDGFHLLMPLFRCDRWRGEPSPREVAEVRFVAAGELAALAMPAADRPLVRHIETLLGV